MRHVFSPQQRLCLRMAVLLEARLVAGEHPWIPRLPDECWQECRRLARMAEKARNWGFASAQREVDRQLRSTLARLRRELDPAFSAELPRPAESPGKKVLYEELVALHEEFEQVKCDLRERTISVVTDPVELDEVYLGPFEIRLELISGQNVPRYRVVALEPHPAASSDETTHPHVRDEHLCEGEGQVRIRRALEQGRLCDFFQIVAQILQTYNPGSAFVSLDDWSGVPCADCDQSVNEDERCSCESCGATLCGSCGRSCGGCSYDQCSECATSCSGCSEDSCRLCLKPCTDCQEQFCRSCLVDGRCEGCREEAAEETTPAEVEPATAAISLLPVVSTPES